eukprot:TRINITY_DN27340_c1_g2_i1.p1 TRINITY_DN27340_c1_g2~~TRINITY_DN27340_c1_g2_i1.p1  ORF type:complete len:819 (-),score=193.41 TRINITY_DN27340_c1_g2_i1:76-2532(-)
MAMAERQESICGQMQGACGQPWRQQRRSRSQRTGVPREGSARGGAPAGGSRRQSSQCRSRGGSTIRGRSRGIVGATDNDRIASSGPCPQALSAAASPVKEAAAAPTLEESFVAVEMEDQSQAAQAEEEDILTIFGGCATSLVDNLLGEALDDYCDEAVSEVEDTVLEAATVAPSLEPCILEAEEAVLQAEADAEEAADWSAVGAAKLDEEEAEPEVSENDVAVAAALTLTLLLEAAGVQRGGGSVERTLDSLQSLLGGGDLEEEADAEDAAPHVVEEDAVSVLSCGSGDAELLQADAAEDVSMEILGSAMQEEFGFDDEDLDAIEQIRGHVRLLLEESVDNGSLEKILLEAEAADDVAEQEAPAPAPKSEMEPSLAALAWLKQEPLSRRKFAPTLCPRSTGAPVPEENFPMDCLPMSKPVVPVYAPLTGTPSTSARGSGTKAAAVRPAAAQNNLATEPPRLTDKSDDELFRCAANALQQLAEKARLEAVGTIQRCWRRHQVRSSAGPEQKPVPVAMAIDLDDIASSDARMPVPPSSPSGGGACGARRRLLARRDAPTAAAPPPTPPAVAAVSSAGPVAKAAPVAAAPPAISKASPVAPPMAPTAPTAPRTSLCRSRPVALLGALAPPPAQRAGADECPLSPGAPMAPPQRPPSRPSSASRRFVRPPAAKASAPQAANVNSERCQVTPLASASCPPRAPPTPRSSARPKAAAERTAPMSAMEMDLYGDTPRESRSSSDAAAVAAFAAQTLRDMPMSPRLSKGTGGSILPLLPQQQKLMAGSVAWSARGLSPRPGVQQKIDGFRALTPRCEVLKSAGSGF